MKLSDRSETEESFLPQIMILWLFPQSAKAIFQLFLQTSALWSESGDCSRVFPQDQLHAVENSAQANHPCLQEASNTGRTIRATRNQTPGADCYQKSDCYHGAKARSWKRVAKILMESRDEDDKRSDASTLDLLRQQEAKSKGMG